MAPPTLAPSVAEFLASMEQQNGIIIHEQPRFDLDFYIQNYTGATRFDRLLLIGKCCAPYCVDALKAAVNEAKQGSDVSRYREAWDCIRKAAPNEAEAVKDDQWIEKTEQANKAETARLEAELKGYKNNLIKESIRMGNLDLGKHFEKIGRLTEAAEAYSRMRQDVSSTKHIVECAIHLADAGMRRRDWPTVITNMAKIATNTGDDEEDVRNYSNLLTTIASMNLEKYTDAARAILRFNGELASSEYSKVASPNDVAIYGGLLGLAILERQELHDKVLHSSGFRLVLDYEPRMRKAVSLFYNGRYSECLSTLEVYRNDCLLDVYLQKHVTKLFSRVRSRCIVQYFSPFSCVTLDSLSSAFGMPDASLEDELVQMIRDGLLNARIDSKNKLLVAVRPDSRAELQKDALRVARMYEQEAIERLRRMSIVAAGLEVTGNKRQVLGPGEGGVVEETLSASDSHDAGGLPEPLEAHG